MHFLHNIRTVALYEAKTLRRSWFFRLFSVSALGIFTFMNIGLFSPVGDEPWEFISIPSSVPLVNLYLLNIAQAIVVIFLAADFMKRDKKLDTNEVLYTRSMSNFEYVTGKTWGILRLFLGLDLIILCIAMVINIISKSMTADYMAYLSYLLIISVPTIIFSLGLAFMLMSLIKNQAVTFLILLGFAALNMFWLYHKAGSIFDYMAFGLPVFKSGMTGFPGLGYIIYQRLMFLFGGLALVAATILLFRRLPQSKLHTAITCSSLIIFAAGATFCTVRTYSAYRKDVNDKELVIETNRVYEEKLFTSLTFASIEFDHKGDSFTAKADLKIINDNNEQVDRYLFSLNPSLIVSQVSSGTKPLTFKKINHIIEIDPEKALLPGQSDSIRISWEGTINESFCYPGYSDNIKEDPFRIAMLNVKKRQAFLTNNYVLLTPESHWYPVTGLNYYPSNPARIKVDFTRYSLRVKTDGGLTPASQGNVKKENEYYYFSPDFPLTGLTLAIGKYKYDKLKVDSVEYITWYYQGHDYYKTAFSELKDTLPLLISGIMRDLETNFSAEYPFPVLSLIEVPVHFHSYPGKNTQKRAEVQPSVVLLPEKLSTLNQSGFRKQLARQKKRMLRSNQVITDKELQVRMFNTFIRNTFISGENRRYTNGKVWNEPSRYLLGPSFYFFKNNFYSSEYPVINAVFESHLQKLNQQNRPGDFMGMPGSLSDNDRANLILKELSFKDLLAKNPGSDTIRSVLTVKGDYLFNLIRSKAGIEEFSEWFRNYLDENMFTRTDISRLNTDIKDRFGFEFYPYLNDWFNNRGQPGFLFSKLQAEEIIEDGRSRYQVTFVVSNPEPVPGLFNIAFRTGGPGGPGSRGMGGGPQMMGGQGQAGGGGRTMGISMQGRGMAAADISRIVLMGPGEAQKVGIVLDAQPRAMMINTLFSLNIPGEINQPVSSVIRSKVRKESFSGEEKLPVIPSFTEPYEIITDNEDQGFEISRQNTSSPLKKMLGIKNKNRDKYQQVRMMNIPEYWQPVVQSSYYGKYIRSSVYTKSGTGDRMLTWKATIDKPGYYMIYTYIGKMGGGMVRMGPGGVPGGPAGQAGIQQRDNPYKDMHYKIYHDEGMEEIIVDFENATDGWNELGRYYLSPDTVKVVLTNLSAGRVVIGDAIKWVRQD
jgi:hypothetical protein